jgi:hypothetical protein
MNDQILSPKIQHRMAVAVISLRDIVWYEFTVFIWSLLSSCQLYKLFPFGIFMYSCKDNNELWNLLFWKLKVCKQNCLLLICFCVCICTCISYWFEISQPNWNGCSKFQIFRSFMSSFKIRTGRPNCRVWIQLFLVIVFIYYLLSICAAVFGCEYLLYSNHSFRCISVLEVYQFARDAAVAEAWLIAQEPYLMSQELGVSFLFLLP